MKKRLIRIALAALSLLAILLPLWLPIVITVATPPIYSGSFVGVLDDKVERLDSVEGEKIVVIGGSSVAFGLDSELMERELGAPVVNFGLYAAIGNLAMMELSKASIGRGDTVILAPEMDPQSLSTYFNAEMTLKAIDERLGLLFRFSNDSKMKLFGRLWAHSTEKLSSLGKVNTSPKGIYSAESFNKYYDIKAGIREENVMPLYYDPNTPITLTPDIVEEAYIDYVNDYTAYCRRRGAKVLFTYSPMNSLAVTDTTAEQVYEFEAFLADKLDCEIVSLAETYIMDAGYFYDSNYHLNDAGVEYRTRRLIEDISGFLMEEGPLPPKLPGVDVEYGGYDPNSEYFLYGEMANGAYKIVGLTEEGKRLRELTVPLGADGKKVMAIDKAALKGSAATSLVVTADTNLRNFLDGCMDGSNIKDIWIYYDFVSEDDKLVPASHFGGVTIHFPPGSIYSTHYDWQDSSGGFSSREDAVK